MVSFPSYHAAGAGGSGLSSRSPRHSAHFILPPRLRFELTSLPVLCGITLPGIPFEHFHLIVAPTFSQPMSARADGGSDHISALTRPRKRTKRVRDVRPAVPARSSVTRRDPPAASATRKVTAIRDTLAACSGSHQPQASMGFTQKTCRGGGVFHELIPQTSSARRLVLLRGGFCPIPRCFGGSMCACIPLTRVP